VRRAELLREIARVVDGDIRNVHVAGGRREHDRDDPSIRGHAPHAPHVTHVEKAPKVRAKRLRNLLPDLLPRHKASINENAFVTTGEWRPHPATAPRSALSHRSFRSPSPNRRGQQPG